MDVEMEDGNTEVDDRWLSAAARLTKNTEQPIPRLHRPRVLRGECFGSETGQHG